MAITIEAKNIENSSRQFEVNRFPDDCPVCHHHIEPKGMGIAYAKGTGSDVRLQVTFRCTRRECQEHVLPVFWKVTFEETPNSFHPSLQLACRGGAALEELIDISRRIPSCGIFDDSIVSRSFDAQTDDLFA